MLSKLFQLAVSFLKIGTFSLGGGNSMLGFIESECVANQGFLSKVEFDTLLGSSFVFPGLTSVKLSGLIGLKVAGVPGLMVSVVCLNLTGLLLSVLFVQWMTEMKDRTFVRRLVTILQYGGMALMATAAFSLMRPLLSNSFYLPYFLLSGVLFIAVAFFNVSAFFGFLGFVLLSLML